MKKAIPCFILMLVILCAAVGLAACNPEHEHTFGDWAVTSAPTCEHIGQETRVCTGCGYEETRDVDKIAHTPVVTEGKAPTCEEAGYTESSVCSECGAVLQARQDLPSIGHKYGDEWIHRVDDEQSDSPRHEHYRVCLNENCGKEEVAACSYEERRIEPTCEKEGAREMYCEVCHHEQILEVLQATGHDYQDPVFDPETHKHIQVCKNDNTHVISEDCRFNNNTVLPKCLEQGYTHHECVICGGTYDDNFVKANGHSFDEWVETEEAECEKEGKHYHTCSVCQEVEWETIKPLGHAWGEYQKLSEHQHKRDCDRCEQTLVEGCAVTPQVTAPTCEDDGYTTYTCEFCHDSYTGDTTTKLGHDLAPYVAVLVDEGTDHKHEHVGKCLRAGCEYEDRQECVLTYKDTVEGNCTMPTYTRSVCEVCNAVHETVTKPAPGHTMRYYTLRDTNPYKHYQKCTVCDYQTDEELCAMEYTVFQPTCLHTGGTQGVCKQCAREVRRGAVIPALGHKMGAWVYEGDHRHYRVCEHEDCDEKEYGDCHEITDVITATCNEVGGTHTYCEDCLEIFDQTEIAAIGHAYGPWMPDEKLGDHYRVCANNHDHIERAAHENVVNEYPATCSEPSKTVTRCNDCHKEVVEEDSSPALGHQYVAEEITADSHRIVCQLCEESHEGAHDFSDSNLCAYCKYDGLVYEKMGAHYIVKSSAAIKNARSKHIVINSMHSALGENEELPVTQISRSLFFTNTYIEDVILPSTLETICYGAFNGCFNLKSVSIEGDESALTTIEEYAFTTCHSLTSFEAPASLATIGDYAFEGCTKLSDIKIISDEIEIGKSAFRNTAYGNNDANWDGNLLYIGKYVIGAKLISVDGELVTEAEIKEGTVTVSAEAFKDVKITSLIIPKTVKLVEANAFDGCDALAKVRFKGSMAEWFEINFESELSSPLYYDASLHIDEAHDRIVIPSTVKRIPAGTFRGTDITSVEIPSSVTWIGADAFEDCALLESVSISDSVTYIGKDAFKNSKFYNDPTKWDSDGVLYIDRHLIAADPAKFTAETYKVKANTLTIGIDAFKGCETLVEVTIAESVVRIGAGVFDGCNNLERVIFESKTVEWLAAGRVLRVVTYGHYSDARSARALFNTYYGEWRKYNV